MGGQEGRERGGGWTSWMRGLGSIAVAILGGAPMLVCTEFSHCDSYTNPYHEWQNTGGDRHTGDNGFWVVDPDEGGREHYNSHMIGDPRNGEAGPTKPCYWPLAKMPAGGC